MAKKKKETPTTTTACNLYIRLTYPQEWDMKDVGALRSLSFTKGATAVTHFCSLCHTAGHNTCSKFQCSRTVRWLGAQMWYTHKTQKWDINPLVTNRQKLTVRFPEQPFSNCLRRQVGLCKDPVSVQATCRRALGFRICGVWYIYVAHNLKVSFAIRSPSQRNLQPVFLRVKKF